MHLPEDHGPLPERPTLPAVPRGGVGRWLSRLLLGIMLLGASACGSFSSDTPPVPDSTMVQILVDLHLSQSRSESLQDVAPGARTEVLQRYNVSPEAFEEATLYYARHPEAHTTLRMDVRDALLELRVPFEE